MNTILIFSEEKVDTIRLKESFIKSVHDDLTYILVKINLIAPHVYFNVTKLFHNCTTLPKC